MAGKGKLTSLLTQKPFNMRKLLDFGRSKKLDLEDLAKLAMRYTQMMVCNEYDSQLTLLHIASSCSKPDVVGILIKEGWSVNLNTKDIESPLFIALDNGNIPAAQLLIECGADPKSVSFNGCTPMMGALSENKREKKAVSAVKLLLDAGVSVDEVIEPRHKGKPIHVATVYNLPLVVSLLLQKGANVNAQDANHSTALHIAAFIGGLDILKLLILHGASFYINDLAGDTPLQTALKRGRKPVVEALVKAGCDINRACGERCVAPLHIAVYLCNLDMVKCLVSLGADVNKTIMHAKTPLHVAATRDSNIDVSENKKTVHVRKEIAEFLVEKGANINATTECNDSPLKIAIESGFISLAKVLIKLGANFNIVQRTNDSLFHDVVMFNRDIITMFLEYGGNYNEYNTCGLSPYHFAISHMVDVKFIKSFVKYGCPYNQQLSVWTNLVQRSNWGVKRFFETEKQFFKGIIENNLLLVKSAVKDGAVPTACSEEIKYPLHYVASKGYTELLNFLLEQRFPPNTLNAHGETALHLAAKSGHYDICCSLLRYGSCYNYYNEKCPKKPEVIASELKDKLIQELFASVRRMFRVVRSKKIRVIAELEKKCQNNLNEFLMFVNTTNIKGDTLLTHALRYKHYDIAQKILELRLSATTKQPAQKLTGGKEPRKNV